MTNSSVILIILGIAFLLVKVQTQTANSKCKNPTTEATSNLTGADCSNGAITNGLIPDNLGDIAFLDISSNTLTEMTETTFSKYASLRMLIMKNVISAKGPLSIQEKSFLPLSQLEQLDMSGTKVASPKLNIAWPKTLQKLNITSCNLETVNVNELKKLTHFYAADNRLQEFPNFDFYTHLTEVDLHNNSIKIMPLVQIAAYCYLTYFNFLYNDFMQNITNDSQYCECDVFIRFIGLHSIQPGLGDVPKCPYDTGADTLQCLLSLEPYNVERRLCFRRKELDVTLGIRVFGVAVFIIGILLLIAAARAKPVVIPKVADTHPFEHHDAETEGNLQDQNT